MAFKVNVNVRPGSAVALHFLGCRLTEIVKRGGSLADSLPFVRRVVGTIPALVAMQGPWASPSLEVTFGASA